MNVWHVRPPLHSKEPRPGDHVTRRAHAGRAVHGTGQLIYRIVQWTTGNVGVKSVHAIVENSLLELVGATRGHRRRSAATSANCAASTQSACLPQTTSTPSSRS